VILRNAAIVPRDHTASYPEDLDLNPTYGFLLKSVQIFLTHSPIMNNIE
jgi:hypothetical protein